MFVAFFFTFFSIFNLSVSFLSPTDREVNSYIQFMVPFGGLRHRQCFVTVSKACFMKIHQEDLSFTATWSQAYMGKNKTDIDWDPLINIQYTDEFVKLFIECTIMKFDDLLKPNIANFTLKELAAVGKPPKNNLIPIGSEIKLRYQKNVYSTVQNCIRSIPCFIKIHHQTVSNILEECTNHGYKEMGISLEEYYGNESSEANVTGKERKTSFFATVQI